MSLLKVLQDDSLEALRTKDPLKSFRQALFGEAKKVGKDNGNRDSTDPEVLKVLSRFKEGLDQNIPLFEKRGDAEKLAEYKGQLAIVLDYLDRFAPKVILMSELELRQIIDAEIKAGADNIGKIMPVLKKNYDGKFDGKLASNIVKEMLAAQ